MWTKCFPLFLYTSSHWPAWYRKLSVVSKADRTVRAYLGVFKRWRNGPHPIIFATCQSTFYSLRFTCSIVLMKSTVSFPANQWLVQHWLSLPKISDHPLVSSMINAAQRLLRRPRVKKDPVTPEMLRALVESKIKDKSPENSCLVSYWLSRIFFVLA